MSRIVYAWPPVRARAFEWTEEAPVAISRSLITGAEYVTAAKRVRRVAAVDVSALAGGRSGGGYMEMLKHFLAGGLNLVRLTSTPVNWHLDAARDAAWRQSQPVVWTDGADDLVWTDGADDLAWRRGAVLSGTTGTAGGWATLTVTGLPPNRLVARPGEYVTVYEEPADATGPQARVVTEAWSDGSGQAVLRLLSALPHGGLVSIGTGVTGIFAARAMPRAKQPVAGDWTYSWEFEERFADELGSVTEVDPWR